MERLHRTLFDEHFRAHCLQKWCESVEEMQKIGDTYLHHYNRERTYQGRNMNGRVQYQAFFGGLSKRETTNKKSTKKTT